MFGSRFGWLAGAFCALMTSMTSAGDPESSTFTYQGQLKQDGAPAKGLYDFQFTLLEDDGVTQVGRTCAFDVTVVNGLFQAEVDFGAAAFDGSPRLLQMGVRPAAAFPDCSPNTIPFLFEHLTPLQEILPAPLAGLALKTVGVDGHSLDAPDGDPIDTLIVGPNGNVGIGSGPLVNDADLLVGIDPFENGTFGGTSIQVGDTSSAQLILGRPGEDSIQMVTSQFGNRINAKGVNGLEFETGPLGANQTRMHLSAEGDIGMGLTSPLAPLHVRDGEAGSIAPHSNTSVVLERSNSNYLQVYAPDANETGLLFGGDTVDIRGGLVFNSGATVDGLQFRTGGNTARMSIDATGRVGIGTTTPIADLHIRGQSSLGSLVITPDVSDSSSQITLAENTSNTFAMIMRYDGTANQLKFAAVNSGVEQAPVLSIARSASPSVGVGTTAPEAPLHVVDGSAGAVTAHANSALVAEGAGNTYLSILSPDASERALIFGEPTSNVAGGIFYNSAATPDGFQFRTATNSTKMVLSAAGNVGIGTTTPAHPLHVVSPQENTLVIENNWMGPGGSGLLSRTSSPSAMAIRGEATTETGFAYGVAGFGTVSPDATGVWGRGNLRGVLGQSLATNGIGVAAFVNGSGATAVFGECSSTSGSARAVHGKVASANGFAGFFEGRGSFSDDVAIGVTGGIDARLHVQDSGRVAKFDRFDSDGELVIWARNDTTVGSVTVSLGFVSYNAFTGSHYAWSSAPIVAGALVSMTGENRRYGDRTNAEVVYGITETARANDPACLGVHLGPVESTREVGPENPLLVAAVGNGEMCVVERGGGDIEPGDYLISSDVPGCAMKDDPARFSIGHVVARAAERVQWSAVTTDNQGVRTAKVSVLFGNFVRAESCRRNDETGISDREVIRELAELRARVGELESLIGRSDIARAEANR